MSELKVSYSKLTTAEDCHLKFYHQYVGKTPVYKRDHPAARLGSAFHETVELWNKGRDLRIEVLFTIWKTVFPQYMSKSGMQKITRNKMAVLGGEGQEMLKNFWNRQVADETVKDPLFNEVAFNIPWETDYGVVIINGFIDRGMAGTPRGMEIEDFKTSKYEPTQKSVDGDLQLTFYSAAYRWMAKQPQNKGKWPEKEDVVSLYFPRKDHRFSSTRGKEHYADMKHRILQMLELLRGNKFLPTPSEKACQYCDFRALCPAMKSNGSTLVTKS